MHPRKVRRLNSHNILQERNHPRHGYRTNRIHFRNICMKYSVHHPISGLFQRRVRYRHPMRFLSKEIIILFVFFIFSPIDMSSNTDLLFLIVNAVMLGKLEQPYILTVHFHVLKGSPQVIYCLTCVVAKFAISLNFKILPLRIITLVVVFAFLSPFFIGEVTVQTFITAIVGYSHVSTIPGTHQSATL